MCLFPSASSHSSTPRASCPFSSFSPAGYPHSLLTSLTSLLPPPAPWSLMHGAVQSPAGPSCLCPSEMVKCLFIGSADFRSIYVWHPSNRKIANVALAKKEYLQVSLFFSHSEDLCREAAYASSTRASELLENLSERLMAW